MVLGDRRVGPPTEPTGCPALVGTIGGSHARRGGALADLDYGHPIFELFRRRAAATSRRRGSFGYRALTAARRPCWRASMAAAGAGRAPAGRGRVLVWTSTLDYWNDLALKPVYLPFVHQLGRHFAGTASQPPWLTVGQVLDPQNRTAGDSSGNQATTEQPKPASAKVALTPDGRRVPFGTRDRPALLELDEQGFYEVRSVTDASVRPFSVAVDLDASESDLTRMDSGKRARGRGGGQCRSRGCRERGAGDAGAARGRAAAGRLVVLARGGGPAAGGRKRGVQRLAAGPSVRNAPSRHSWQGCTGRDLAGSVPWKPPKRVVRLDGGRV